MKFETKLFTIMSILLTFFYVNYEVVDAANNASEYGTEAII